MTGSPGKTNQPTVSLQGERAGLGPSGEDSRFLGLAFNRAASGDRLVAFQESYNLGRDGHPNGSLPDWSPAGVEGTAMALTAHIQPGFADEGLESGKVNHLRAAEPAGYAVWLWADLETTCLDLPTSPPIQGVAGNPH